VGEGDNTIWILILSQKGGGKERQAERKGGFPEKKKKRDKKGVIPEVHGGSRDGGWKRTRAYEKKRKAANVLRN